MVNNAQDIISKFPDEADRYLLGRIRSNDVVSAEGEQAATILQMRMVDRLIESLNNNSASSDKLAGRLNWLTLAIAVATCVGAFAAIIQLGK